MYLTTLIRVRVPEHDVVDSQIFGCVCQVHGRGKRRGNKILCGGVVSHRPIPVHFVHLESKVAVTIRRHAHARKQSGRPAVPHATLSSAAPLHFFPSERGGGKSVQGGGGHIDTPALAMKILYGTNFFIF